jgi:hypothetical protein
MTEAVVLSFANPSDTCSMVGNNHTNFHGFYKFKKIALKLKDQWQMTFRTCISTLLLWRIKGLFLNIIFAFFLQKLFCIYTVFKCKEKFEEHDFPVDSFD